MILTLLRLPVALALVFYQSIILAFTQIWANKIRGILTTLGVLIGIAAISAVIALLTGMKQRVLAEFEAFGANKIMINGRVPVNPHGGALSEGATQGSGHVREAVLQLRGQAGERQVPGARTAFLTPGGFFFNAQGLVLWRD